MNLMKHLKHACIAASIFAVSLCSIHTTFAAEYEESDPSVGWRKISKVQDIKRDKTVKSSLKIDWTPPVVTPSNGIGGYKILRRNAGVGEFESIGGVDSPATSFNDLTAVNGEFYDYAIYAAVDSIGTRPSDSVVFENASFGIATPKNFVVKANTVKSFMPYFNFTWASNPSMTYEIKMSSTADFADSFVLNPDSFGSSRFAPSYELALALQDQIYGDMYLALRAQNEDGEFSAWTPTVKSKFLWAQFDAPKIETNGINVAGFVEDFTFFMNNTMGLPQYRLNGAEWVSAPIGTVAKGKNTVVEARMLPDSSQELFGLTSPITKLSCVYKNHTWAGTGDESSPYLIKNMNDLWVLQQRVNAGESYDEKYFKVTADLNFQSLAYTKHWNPIGNNTNSFMGIFDGNSKKLSNMVIPASLFSLSGLFGNLEGAKIQNCNLENASVPVLPAPTLHIGSIKEEIIPSGGAFGFIAAKASDVTILNCSVNGTVSYAYSASSSNVSSGTSQPLLRRLSTMGGGLVGFADQTTVEGSSVRVKCEKAPDENGIRFGGFFAQLSASSSSSASSPCSVKSSWVDLSESTAPFDNKIYAIAASTEDDQAPNVTIEDVYSISCYRGSVVEEAFIFGSRYYYYSDSASIIFSNVDCLVSRNEEFSSSIWAPLPADLAVTLAPQKVVQLLDTKMLLTLDYAENAPVLLTFKSPNNPRPFTSKINLSVKDRPSFVSVDATPVVKGSKLKASAIVATPSIKGRFEWEFPDQIIDQSGQHAARWISEDPRYRDVGWMVPVEVGGAVFVVSDEKATPVWILDKARKSTISCKVTLADGTVLSPNDYTCEFVEPGLHVTQSDMFTFKIVLTPDAKQRLDARFGFSHTSSSYPVRVDPVLPKLVAKSARFDWSQGRSKFIEVAFENKVDIGMLPDIMFFSFLPSQWDPVAEFGSDTAKITYIPDDLLGTVQNVSLTFDLDQKKATSNSVPVGLLPCPVINDVSSSNGLSLQFRVDPGFTPNEKYPFTYTLYDGSTNKVLKSGIKSSTFEYMESSKNLGQERRYYVRSVFNANKKLMSDSSHVVYATIKLAQVKNLKQVDALNLAKFTWDKVPGATSYEVVYGPLSSRKIVDVSTNSITILPRDGIEPNVNYGIHVSAKNGEHKGQSTDEHHFSIVDEKAPTIAFAPEFSHSDSLVTQLKTAPGPTAKDLRLVSDFLSDPIHFESFLLTDTLFTCDYSGIPEDSRGVLFTYRVGATTDPTGASYDYSNEVQGWFKLPAPALRWLSPCISWNPLKNAKTYRVYCAKNENPAPNEIKPLTGWMTQTSYLITNSNPDYPYYAVKASFRTKGQTEHDGEMSTWSSFEKVQTLGTAQIGKIETTPDGIKISEFTTSKFPHTPSDYCIYLKSSDGYTFVEKTESNEYVDLTDHYSYPYEITNRQYVVQARCYDAQSATRYVSQLSAPKTSYFMAPPPDVLLLSTNPTTFEIMNRDPSYFTAVVRYDSKGRQNVKFMLSPESLEKNRNIFMDASAIPGNTYFYQFYYCLNAKGQNPGQLADRIPIPLPLGNFKARALSLLGKVKLSWKYPRGAQYYRVIHNGNCISDPDGKWKKGTSFIHDLTQISPLLPQYNYLVEVSPTNEMSDQKPIGQSGVTGFPGLYAPVNLKAKAIDASCIRLTWEKPPKQFNLEGAPTYTIYRSEMSNLRDARVIGKVDDLTLVFEDRDAGLVSGKDYYYCVGVNESQIQSKTVKANKPFPPVRDIRVSQGVRASSLQVAWNVADMTSTHYRLYRSPTTSALDAVPLTRWTMSRSFDDKDLNIDFEKDYYYFVAAAANASGKYASELGPYFGYGYLDASHCSAPELTAPGMVMSIATDSLAFDSGIGVKSNPHFTPKTARITLAQITPSVVGYYTHPATGKKLRLAYTPIKLTSNSVVSCFTKTYLPLTDFAAYAKALKQGRSTGAWLVDTNYKAGQLPYIEVSPRVLTSANDIAYGKAEWRTFMKYHVSAPQVQDWQEDNGPWLKSFIDIRSSDNDRIIMLRGHFVGPNLPRAYLEFRGVDAANNVKLVQVPLTVGFVPNRLVDPVTKSKVQAASGEAQFTIKIPKSWKTKAPWDSYVNGSDMFIVIRTGSGLAVFPCGLPL